MSASAQPQHSANSRRSIWLRAVLYGVVLGAVMLVVEPSIALFGSPSPSQSHSETHAAAATVNAAFTVAQWEFVGAPMQVQEQTLPTSDVVAALEAGFDSFTITTDAPPAKRADAGRLLEWVRDSLAVLEKREQATVYGIDHSACIVRVLTVHAPAQPERIALARCALRRGDSRQGDDEWAVIEWTGLGHNANTDNAPTLLEVAQGRRVLIGRDAEGRIVTELFLTHAPMVSLLDAWRRCGHRLTRLDKPDHWAIHLGEGTGQTVIGVRPFAIEDQPMPAVLLQRLSSN